MCPFPRRAFTVALATLLALAGLAALFLAAPYQPPPPSHPVPLDPGSLEYELHALHEEHARKLHAFLASNRDLPGEEVRLGLEALHRDLEKKLWELHCKHGRPCPND
jgi:hypothetical protein